MIITKLRKNILTLGTFATLAASSQASVLFTETFDDNSNGWTAGTVAVGTLSLNGQATANNNLYTIGAGATVLTLEADVTWNTGGTPWFYMGLNDGAAAADGSSTLGTFGGSGANGWRYRDGASGATTNSSVGYPTDGVRTDHFTMTYTITGGDVIMTTAMNGGAVGIAFDTLDSDFTNIDGIYFRAGSGGNAVFDNVVVSDNIAVPEPSSAALLGLGGLALLLRRRSRA